MGKKGVTGLNGRRGEPGNNDECILGEISQDLISMQVNLHDYSTPVNNYNAIA